MKKLALTVLAATLLSGCQQSNEVPLIEFPKGAPAAPPESKEKAKSPEGANTSKSDPTTDPR